MRRFILIAAWLVAVAPAAGCGDIKESRTDSYQMQSLEHACGSDADFTGDAILGQLETPYRAPMYEPYEEDLATVSLDIDYDDGALRCFPGEGERAARLKIGVDLSIESDDGSFDETIPGMLSGYADSSQFRVAGRIPYAERRGLFGRSQVGVAGEALLVEGWVDLESSITQGAIRLLGVEGEEGPENRTVATWDEGRHTLQYDSQPCGVRPDFTRQSFLRALGTPRRAPLEFEQRPGRATVQVTVSYADQSVLCEPQGAPDGGPAMAAETRIEIWATDGTLVETMMGHARMRANGTLLFEARGPATTAEALSYASGLLEKGRDYQLRIAGTLDVDTQSVHGVLVADPAGEGDEPGVHIARWGS